MNRPIVQDRVSFNFVGQPGRMSRPGVKTDTPYDA